VGTYSLASALLILAFGSYENKRPKEKFIKLSVTIYTLSDVVLLSLRSLEGLVVFLMLGAIGSGIFFPAQKTLFAKNEKRGQESEEWSWIDSGNMLAAAMGSSIGGIVLGLYGFNGLFAVMACIQAIAVIVAFTSL
jgi:MFS family permease